MNTNAHHPLVSVIVPVWNKEPFLRRCFDSIVSQSYPNMEVIVVDDGSTDGGGAIIDEYASAYPHFKAYHKPNAGAAEARRSGIEASGGEWIMFVDADDSLHDRDAISFLTGKCVENDLDFAYGTIQRITSTQRFFSHFSQEGEFSAQWYRDKLFTRGSISISPCECVMRRDLWAPDVFPPAHVRLPAEDLYTNILLSQRLTRKVGFYNHVVYDYYQVEGSLSMGGKLYNYQLFKQFFTSIASKITKGIENQSPEQSLLTLEMHYMCFVNGPLNLRDPWLRKILRADVSHLSRRTRLEQLVMRNNAVRLFLIRANRSLKRLLHRRRMHEI